ncbi:hypothetical protein JTE90_022887 [Oedothorax gibbosus]|uniref:Uncharacterized protein n=1 Tax=Oedothorax gibbosus TaxID=931172 RepID=A0AAV6UUK8_9ARAC|nr:hypothetical protein JTE90_022887 [Oedothorax gibbosus]
MRQGPGAGLPEIDKEVRLEEVETRLGILACQLGEPGDRGAGCPGLYLRAAGIGNRDASGLRPIGNRCVGADRPRGRMRVGSVHPVDQSSFCVGDLYADFSCGRKFCSYLTIFYCLVTHFLRRVSSIRLGSSVLFWGFL